ncbi:MAG: hypothetical protein LBJ63_06815 [Prevotellaceae bacterium]|jgi:hypothetical protein|nr:hypothetical protein [Prevotellaceae bacterium]
MKNLIIILSALILNTGCAQTATKNQDIKFIDFVNSFEEEKSDDVLGFGYLIYGRYNKRKPMTKDEALSFVYHTEDTTVLYCTVASISQETEKITAIFTSLYLPDKYFRIEKEKYFLIGYSSYQCGTNNGMTKRFIYLLLMDANYSITDKLLVYEDEGDWNYISGLLNPENGKIFLSGRKKATMYIIDESSLTFKVKKESNEINDIEYSSKALENLGWEEYFLE